MTKELAIVQSLGDITQIADIMSASGYFADARDAAQVAVKILAGREMGFGPFASATGVHIIKGRPAIGANLMAAAVKAHPKYDYRIRQMTTDVCEIEFYQSGESLGVSTFTIQDARDAGTQNLQKYARNMLFARAMSNGVRWYTPDVFMGSAVYTPEELGAPVNEDGNLIEHEPAPALPSASVSEPKPDAPTLSKDDAQRLHIALSKFGYDGASRLDLVKRIVDREIESLTELTKAEARAVYAAAAEENDHDR